MEAVANLVGLLPPSIQSTRAYTEVEQREWFLRESQAAVTRQFKKSTNTSRTDIVMTFSRVNISQDITFNAISFEVEMDPQLLATTSAQGNTTFITQVFQAAYPRARQSGERSTPQNCGPWPALCLVKKPMYRPNDRIKNAVDALQQVHAFGACVNVNGRLQLHREANGSNAFRCDNTSDSAMMIYSVGKRLVASAIEQSKTTSDGDSAPAMITNLRKVYTFTVGRLEWKLQSLSETFNAKCAAGALKCQGLQLPLVENAFSFKGPVPQASGGGGDSDEPQWISTQHLVVSAHALPTKLLVPSGSLSAWKPRSVPLVEVSDPPYDDITTGDVLMPHNVGSVTWENRTITNKACDADIETLLFTKINNHMYIEHGFQTAYTAATFFLFQNAVVKDSVQLSGDKVSLAFDLNTQDMVVWMSTPKQNTYLTLAGCVLLVLGLVAALKKAARLASTQHDDPLSAITAPQAIARVMLDDHQFPAMLLHRRVVDTSKTNVEYRKLEQFTIPELSVQHQDGCDRLTAME